MQPGNLCAQNPLSTQLSGELVHHTTGQRARDSVHTDPMPTQCRGDFVRSDPLPGGRDGELVHSIGAQLSWPVD